MDLLMNKNAIGFNQLQFFFLKILGQCCGPEKNEKVSSNYIIFQRRKRQRLHFLNPLSFRCIPRSCWDEVKPNRPRRFGGNALLYFSRLGPVIFAVTLRNQGSVSKKHVWLLKMGKRDLLTVQVLSPALAVLRACAGHPKCQRTDQQPAADGEN